MPASAFGAAPVELLVDSDTGVNETLNRIFGQYEKKAEYLSLLGVRPARNGMYYEKAAAAIGTLQLQ